MNARDFSQKISIEIPEKMRDNARRIFFDVGTQLHAAVIEETPVVTGYLRSSLAFTSGNDSPPLLEKPVRGTNYTGEVPDPGNSLSHSVQQFIPWTMGFRADYALYVEDVRHMVKDAFSRAGSFVSSAVANARSS